MRQGGMDESSHTWNVMTGEPQRRESLKKEKVSDSKWKIIWNDYKYIKQTLYLIAKWICLWSKQLYLKELE